MQRQAQPRQLQHQQQRQHLQLQARSVQLAQGLHEQRLVLLLQAPVVLMQLHCLQNWPSLHCSCQLIQQPAALLLLLLAAQAQRCFLAAGQLEILVRHQMMPSLRLQLLQVRQELQLLPGAAAAVHG
jgi:hypothetical protein